MCPIKLETFTPQDATPQASSEKIMRRIRTAYDEGHTRGFAEGAAASAIEHADAQDQLRSQFIESLNDQRLSHQEARHEVTKSILPTLHALINKLAPNLAKAGLPGIVEEVLNEAMQTAQETRPILRCAPDLAEGIRNALSDHEGSFEIAPDPHLTPLEARVIWDEGFTHIDLQRCIDSIDVGINSFAATLTETQEDTNVG